MSLNNCVGTRRTEAEKNAVFKNHCVTDVMTVAESELFFGSYLMNQAQVQQVFL